MAAEIWALFGLMVASLGVLATALFFAIGRIDGLRSDTNRHFDNLRIEINGRFDAQQEDIREVRTAIGNLDRRLAAAGG